MSNTSDGNCSASMSQKFPARKRIDTRIFQRGLRTPPRSKFVFFQFPHPERLKSASVPRVQDNSFPPIMLQPWMRKEVLTKFGRTTNNKWQPQSNTRNPFGDHLRADIDPLPIEKRIRYWKLARGDRVRFPRLNAINEFRYE